VNLSDNTVLITGGSSGIGLAFAERFLRAGSDVLICGRREDKLRSAAEKLGQIANREVRTRVCDVADEDERIALFEWVTHEFPRLNVLVNNAGIQRRIDLLHTDPWHRTRQEIAINFEAPVHLARLFIPHLLRQQRAPAILNVTSGLAFAPLANVPVYCATKAALRSFTLSLRHQLAATPIRVIEIIPPAVDTDLQAPGLHAFGAPVDQFADAVFTRLATDDDAEIAYGFADNDSRASREELEQIFARLNAQQH
jgi:uncharacterized oxidoreductase